MEITFNSNGNEKQKEAYKLWSDKKTNDIVYGGSKGCVIGNTEIITSEGIKEIKDVRIGEYVLSYNTSSRSFQYKKVLNRFKYINDEAVVKVWLKDKSSITCTLNHKFLSNGKWQEISDIIGRKMEACKGHRGEILHIEQGASFNDRLEGFNPNKDNEACDRRERLLSRFYTNKGEIDYCKDAPVSSSALHTQSIKQKPSKSYRFRQDKQQGRELGVGYTEGERPTLIKSRSSCGIQERGEAQKSPDWRTGRKCYPYSGYSKGDKAKTQTENIY